MRLFGWLTNAMHDDIQASAFDGHGINPATGLPMMDGMLDVGGNLFGDSGLDSMTLDSSIGGMGLGDPFDSGL